MSRLLLGVNVDHCATLRQARYREYPRSCGQMVEPDPLMAALLAERAGADGITIHLREDRRHVQESDVRRVRESIQTRVNLEMACTDEMLAFALDLRPDSVCLVPESREEVTTEGGLDVAGQRERVGKICRESAAAGIMVSLFIDHEASQIEAAKELGAPWIELHTGAYANAFYEPAQREAELEKLRAGAEHAHALGLVVNAGHGLNYVNTEPMLEVVPHLHELNIGHSIFSRAIFTGLEEAVREMGSKLIAYAK